MTTSELEIASARELQPVPMADEQSNALLDLAALVRSLCNDCSKDHNIPLEIIREMLAESNCIYEEGK